MSRKVCITSSHSSLHSAKSMARTVSSPCFVRFGLCSRWAWLRERRVWGLGFRASVLRGHGVALGLRKESSEL